MTRYVADANETMCLICRQPVVPTEHESSNFGDGRTSYRLKFDLRQTATADLEQAMREAQTRQRELTEEYARLTVLVDKAQALARAWEEFRFDSSSGVVGTVFEAARDVASAAERLDLVAANNDNDDDVEDEYLGEYDDYDDYDEADDDDEADEAEIDQKGSFGY